MQSQAEPDDPFVLARHCEVLSRDKKNDAALEIALRICFLPAEENTWPSEKAWEVARTAKFADRLAQRFRQRMKAGNRPTLGAFSCMAVHVMRNAEKRDAQPRLSIWFPRGGARELKRLVREISEVPGTAANIGQLSTACSGSRLSASGRNSLPNGSGCRHSG